jgi:hypothetical protein
MTDAALSIRVAALEVRVAALEAALGTEPRPHDLADAEVLTVDRLARLWEMKPAKVRELLRTGRLPGRKFGAEGVGHSGRRAPGVGQAEPG